LLFSLHDQRFEGAKNCKIRRLGGFITFYLDEDAFIVGDE